MGIKIKNKLGQVTIFVILSVLLVSLIVGIYFFSFSPKTNVNPTENPQEFLEKCKL